MMMVRLVTMIEPHHQATYSTCPDILRGARRLDYDIMIRMYNKHLLLEIEKIE